MNDLEDSINLFIEHGFPKYDAFYGLLLSLDYEKPESIASKILDAFKEAQAIELGMKVFCLNLFGKSLGEQKSFLEIEKAYGKTNRAEMVKKMYKNIFLHKKGYLTNEEIKKLMFQKML